MAAATAVADYGKPGGPAVRERYGVTFNQGIGAEMMVDKWGFTRTQLDEFAAAVLEYAREDGDAPIVSGNSLGGALSLRMACTAWYHQSTGQLDRRCRYRLLRGRTRGRR